MMDVEEFLATRVKPGETVILRATSPMSMNQIVKVTDNLNGIFDKCGVRFILLDSELEIAAIQDAP